MVVVVVLVVVMVVVVVGGWRMGRRGGDPLRAWSAVKGEKGAPHVDVYTTKHWLWLWL